MRGSEKPSATQIIATYVQLHFLTLSANTRLALARFIHAKAQTTILRLPPVLFMDSSVMVVNKYSGFECQPARLNPNGSFGDVLRGWKREYDLPELLIPIHRLDKSTTGALLFARNKTAARDLAGQFFRREIQKTYFALVHAPDDLKAPSEGRIVQGLWIRHDGRVSLDSSPRNDDENGEWKNAITEWKVLGRSSSLPIALVQLNLITGLKHQLRIHLAHKLQAPILGEPLYGNSATAAIQIALKISDDILLLHAAEMSLWRYNKESGKRFRLSISAPVPEEFETVCKATGIQTPVARSQASTTE